VPLTNLERRTLPLYLLKRTFKTSTNNLHKFIGVTKICGFVIGQHLGQRIFIKSSHHKAIFVFQVGLGKGWSRSMRSRACGDSQGGVRGAAAAASGAAAARPRGAASPPAAGTRARTPPANAAPPLSLCPSY
jgi:hypothetical protein